MDATYFKNQIMDELNGAKCYIMKAIDLKPMAPAWSKMLVEISASELKHAEYLKKMFDEYYQKVSEVYKKVPEYIEKSRNEIIDVYSEEVNSVKKMHEMFNQ